MVARVGSGARVCILLIDDEKLVACSLCRYLRRVEPNWIVHWIDTPQAGIEEVLSGRYKVVIVDVCFPTGPSGFEIVRTLRRLGCEAKILTLTGKCKTVDDCDLSAAAGADGHVLKSGQPEELRRRIRFALARASSERVVRSDELDLELDLVAQRASVAGKPMALTALRWALLLRLVQGSGEVVLREQLWECAAVDPARRSAKALNKHIRTLSAELDKQSGGTGPVIITVWGTGYALVPRAPGAGLGGAPPQPMLRPGQINFLPRRGKWITRTRSSRRARRSPNRRSRSPRVPRCQEKQPCSSSSRPEWSKCSTACAPS